MTNKPFLNSFNPGFAITKELWNRGTSDHKVLAVAQKIAHCIAAIFTLIAEAIVYLLGTGANAVIWTINLLHGPVETDAIENSELTPGTLEAEMRAIAEKEALQSEVAFHAPQERFAENPFDTISEEDNEHPFRYATLFELDQPFNKPEFEEEKDIE